MDGQTFTDRAKTAVAQKKIAVKLCRYFFATFGFAVRLEVIFLIGFCAGAGFVAPPLPWSFPLYIFHRLSLS